MAGSGRFGLAGALIAALMTASAWAQPAARPANGPDPYGTFAFILENDTFSGDDRYYTNGFLFAWRSRSYDPPSWLAGLGDRPSLMLPQGGALRWGLAFGQKKWTPEDTTLRNPPLDDRPYAAWLYGAITFHAYTPTELGTFELQLGIVGPGALGEQVQNNTHDFLNIDRALGWDTQIKDEFGFNLVGTRQWRFNRPTGWDGISVGIVPSVAASLGNVNTYVGAGAMLRIGSELEADFGPPRVRPVSAGSVFFQPDERIGWYAFAGIEGRAVFRDISLDGNTWRESRSVSRETLVGDASLGLAFFWRGTRLTATYTIRTEEFEQQREASQFGSLSVAFRF